jgi:hypothetical protein
MNGNITQDGIRHDLEWMKRIGIGGVQQFDASFRFGGDFQTPQLVKEPLVYMSPEWRETFRYSVGLAEKLGLEFAIASSPGWNETGGPWIKPQQAMKKLVWSETVVQGGEPFNGHLAQPPKITGLFQSIPLRDLVGPHSDEPANAEFYSDVATIAYPTPESEVAVQGAITTSSGKIADALLSDGDLTKTVELPFGSGKSSWIQFSFRLPQRVQAVTAVIPRSLYLSPGEALNGWIEASDDGQQFRRIAGLLRSNALQQTVSFPATVALVFRVVLERPPMTHAEELGITPTTGVHRIAELVLHSAPRVNRFEDKAGYTTWPIQDEDATPSVTTEAIRRSDIIDLTNRVRGDGTVDWTPPRGRWTVLRFGYSLTGKTNYPAPLAGTGLEVDKLSQRHVKAYMDEYLGELERTLTTRERRVNGLSYMLSDSYEAGPQNWTDDMLTQFKERRGYDALFWLPVLAGRVVDSSVSSDRFLWDFRQTISDLIAQAHYGQISASLRQHGMSRYGESHEARRAMIADGMEVKKTAEIPMGAMWADTLATMSRLGQDADIRESASVAHVYGKKLVAAESFTAYGNNSYAYTPEMLKPIADREMALGVNRFVIHTSVHQPNDTLGPSLGLGPIGQWFTRKETWAEQAGAWVDYLSRSSYLLQQGKFVADIAYLYGEDTNITALFDSREAPIPKGYSFDFINADALINEFSVEGGHLLTRSGMAYRLLVLDSSVTRPSLRVLRKIRELAQAGAIVVGAKPIESPSLADDTEQYRLIADELWGSSAGKRKVGSGEVFAGFALPDVLLAVGLTPDLILESEPAEGVRFLHRALDKGDLYFLSSSSPSPVRFEASFRVEGRQPELWRAEDGSISLLSYRIENGRTIIPLSLEPNDAVFVVFRESLVARERSISEPTRTVLSQLSGPWDVSFQEGRGAPNHAQFQTLSSWTESADVGIKNFSGTATYSIRVNAKRAWLAPGRRLEIDLGQVKNVAKVIVNGRPLRVLWKSPFRADLTGALKAGENRLQVEVTNLWPNRLIGDKQPGASKVAFAVFDPFKADSPLLPSGLLGPVKLIGVE